MKAGIICFTEHGVLLAEQLVNGLAAHGILCEAWLKKKEYGQRCCGGSVSGRNPVRMDGGAVRSKDLLIFIGSTGIAVRSIALTCRARRQTGGDRGG